MIKLWGPVNQISFYSNKSFPMNKMDYFPIQRKTFKSIFYKWTKFRSSHLFFEFQIQSFLRIWKQTFVPLHFLRLMLSNSFLYLKIFFGTEKFPFFEWLVFWEQNWIFLMNNTIYFNFLCTWTQFQSSSFNFFFWHMIPVNYSISSKRRKCVFSHFHFRCHTQFCLLSVL